VNDPWVVILLAVIAAFQAIAIAIIQRNRAETKAQTDQVAETLAENQTNTDAKLDKGLKIQRATHTLVNHSTEVALEGKVADRRHIVELEDTPHNRAALRVAEEALAVHRRQQAEVNAEYGEEATQMGTEHGGGTV